MCGRFTLRAPATVIAQEFQLSLPDDLKPRYNVAPTQAVLVAVHDDAGQRVARRMKWGLIPSWAKDTAIGNSLINARAETIAEKPSFRAAFKRRRCLVLADGYYEWQKTDGKKQPFHIHLASGLPFGIAGLWEVWGDGNLESCTVITTNANESTRAIHDRMPVILDAADYSLWLDTTHDNREQLLALLHPCDAGLLVADPVSTHVNNPRHEDPQCLNGSD